MPGADEIQDPNGTGAVDDQQKRTAGAQGSEVENKADDQREMSPEEMKAEIKKLRGENANRRTTAKNLEAQLQSNNELVGKVMSALGIQTEDEQPEVVVDRLKGSHAALETELGITQIAYASGVPAEHSKYFSFLFQEALEGLDEGEELSAETIEEIVQQTRSLGSPKKSTSGAGAGASGATPPSGAGSGITLEKFCQMNVLQKQELYRANQAEYTRLFGEAKQKKMIR